MRIVNDIEQQIQESEAGALFFVSDFAKAGNDVFISRLLSKFAKTGLLCRLAKGVYYKPIQTRFGILYPEVGALVKAIAHRDNAHVLPTGETAQNMLGLFTQVPMNYVYLTSGSARKIGICTNKMKYLKTLSILALGLIAVACGNPAQKSSEAELIDSVTEALANGGQINPAHLQWTREPQAFEVKDGVIAITTAPHTDLWQRTYYHFRNDNAPVLQMKTREHYFSFVVKTDFTQSHQRFDQCGVVMYLDSDNWLKGSVEFENEEFQHLGSVATNNGYSDWATTAIPADVKTMWSRFSRRSDDYCIECSTDGVNFSQMRICHMYEGADEIAFGIYARSPEESSFTAIFSDMKITECMWKAHDGQQPDE